LAQRPEVVLAEDDDSKNKAVPPSAVDRAKDQLFSLSC